jgi:hypothetical protein
LILKIDTKPARFIPASYLAQRRFAAQRPTYKKGSDIGEKMRAIPWDDDT